MTVCCYTNCARVNTGRTSRLRCSFVHSEDTRREQENKNEALFASHRFFCVVGGRQLVKRRVRKCSDENRNLIASPISELTAGHSTVPAASDARTR